MSIHAIAPTRSRGQRRVDGVESQRHRADAVTGATSGRWRVASTHLISTQVDIAGPVWDGKASCATGFGAKTMAAWVEARAAASDFGAPF